MIDVVARVWAIEARVLEVARPAFLTLVRLYWGWAFATNGWGKLHHLDDIAAWFGNDLHIPMPYANAVAASCTELFGGIALLIGLGGRVLTIPLVVTMSVAYATSDLAGLRGLWTSSAACELPNCQAFEDAAPFSFLMAALLVLLFGPGPISVDAAIARWWTARSG